MHLHRPILGGGLSRALPNNFMELEGEIFGCLCHFTVVYFILFNFCFEFALCISFVRFYRFSHLFVYFCSHTHTHTYTHTHTHTHAHTHTINPTSLACTLCVSSP